MNFAWIHGNLKRFGYITTNDDILLFGSSADFVNKIIFIANLDYIVLFSYFAFDYNQNMQIMNVMTKHMGIGNLLHSIIPYHGKYLKTYLIRLLVRQLIFFILLILFVQPAMGLWYSVHSV